MHLSTDSVKNILGQYRACSASYSASGLTLYDHLPMGVSALAAMGASAERVDAWAKAYAEKHALGAADTTERELRRQWSTRFANDGRENVLRSHLGRLMNGVGAAAFHPAIRTAYALERDDDEDLIAALASWDHEYLEILPDRDAKIVSLDDALAHIENSTITVQHRGLISTRMQLVREHPDFSKIAKHIPSANDFAELNVASAAAFAHSGSFTALHVMTGTHAVGILAPYIDDFDAAMKSFWCAFAAAILVAGTTRRLSTALLDSIRREPTPDWGAMLAAATSADDEHIIKATYTAWRLDARYKDSIFRVAAYRYMRPNSAFAPEYSI